MTLLCLLSAFFLLSFCCCLLSLTHPTPHTPSAAAGASHRIHWPLDGRNVFILFIFLILFVFAVLILMHMFLPSPHRAFILVFISIKFSSYLLYLTLVSSIHSFCFAQVVLLLVTPLILIAFPSSLINSSDKLSLFFILRFLILFYHVGNKQTNNNHREQDGDDP